MGISSKVHGGLWGIDLGGATLRKEHALIPHPSRSIKNIELIPEIVRLVLVPH